MRVMRKITAAILAAIGVHQHLSAEQKQDLVYAAIHSTPGAVAGSAARIGGLPLSDWLVVASIGFIALQAGYLVWKWRRDYRRDAARRAIGRHAEETIRGDL